MNYENASDFEINKAVAESMNPNAIIEYDYNDTECVKKSKKGVIVCPMNCREAFIFNPCNNPSDAWPIIVENEIGINFVGAIHCWISESGLSNQFAHANPLRAAMIVYLMMQEGI